MNKQQFEAYLSRSQETWERMEAYRLAYINDVNKLSKYSDSVKWATIALGFLIGVLSIPLMLNVTVEYIVSILGICTATLAIIDKYFRWDERSHQAWSNQKSLDSLQRELYNYLLDILQFHKPSNHGLFLEQIDVKSDKYTSLKVNNYSEWRDKARASMKQHRISSVTYIPTEAETHSFEEDAPPSENAIDIQAVTRG